MHTPNETHTEHYNMPWKEAGELIDSAVETLLDAVEDGAKYSAVFGVPRGGMVLAAAISNRLKIPFIIDVEVLKHTRFENCVILADDICDTGSTIINLQRDIKHHHFVPAVVVAKHAGIRNLQMHGLQIINNYKEMFDETWVHFPWEDPHK